MEIPLVDAGTADMVEVEAMFEVVAALRSKLTFEVIGVDTTSEIDVGVGVADDNDEDMYP